MATCSNCKGIDPLEMENARIDTVYLGNGDQSHGVFSAFFGVNYGGSGQGFWFKPERLPELLEVAEVDDFMKLKGRYIRVQHDWRHVHAVSNILKEDWVLVEQEK